MPDAPSLVSLLAPWVQGIPAAVWLLAPLIVAVAYTVFGMTGFGASIIMLPVLAQLMPLKQIVPMAALVDVVAAFTVNRHAHRDAHWGEVRRIVPAQLLGMGLGAYTLAQAPAQLLMGGLGLFVLLYALYNIRKPELRGDWPAWAAWPVGFAGGVFSAMFGTGGPIYVIYLSRRCPQLAQMRATVAALIMISTLSRVTLFALGGFYANASLLALAAWCMVFMLAAVAFGMWLHSRVAVATVLRLIYGLLVVSGAGLLWRALTSFA
jgi:uncharacterized protein